MIAQLAQGKTFEVQVKVLLEEHPSVEDILDQSGVAIVKPSVRRQYDTYFLFDDPYRSRLRHREDEVLNALLRTINAIAAGMRNTG